MTILAQFNDCHCCNDARSLVQKKNIGLSFVPFLDEGHQELQSDRPRKDWQFCNHPPFVRVHELRVFWFVFVFVGVFVSALGRHLVFFAFHLFSYNVRIADRPQDVLMTVRASSVHMS